MNSWNQANTPDDGDDRHRRIEQPGTEKKACSIGKVINRLGEKIVDLAFADFGRDLPLVICRRHQVVHEENDHEVVDDLAEVVAAYV